MSEELIREGPNVPTEERALARLRRAVELGELEELPAVPPHSSVAPPRYLVTFMKSDTTTNPAMRSATVVSVTNQSRVPNLVIVMFYKGLTDDFSPVGTVGLWIPPQFTVNFKSRPLPDELTVTTVGPPLVPNPPLTFDEGRAIVSAKEPEIGVSARVYYTAGDDDTLHAITDSKVVVYGGRNNGD